MRIIFDIQTSPGTVLSASGSFLTELIEEMALNSSHHSFIYLANDDFPKKKDLPGNVIVHYRNNVFSKWFGKRFWRKYIVAREVRNLKANLYVGVDNIFLKKTSIPVLLFLFHATETINSTIPGKTIKSRIILENTISKADSVIAFSESDRRLVQSFPQQLNKSIAVFMPYPIAIPELKWTEKEMVKIDFAGGLEYFVFVGDLHERYDLIGLLKAFSSFKKRQQSNMRLIIAGNKTNYTDKFKKEYLSFKYRNEVNLLIDPSKETLAKIIAGAYAFVYPAFYDNFPVNIIYATQAGVPVIATPLKVCKEWFGDTIMYPESNDSAGFTESLQLIYKDERLRSDLIESAKKHLSIQSRSNLVEKCMIFFDETMAK